MVPSWFLTSFSCFTCSYQVVNSSTLLWVVVLEALAETPWRWAFEGGRLNLLLWSLALGLLAFPSSDDASLHDFQGLGALVLFICIIFPGSDSKPILCLKGQALLRVSLSGLPSESSSSVFTHCPAGNGFLFWERSDTHTTTCIHVFYTLDIGKHHLTVLVALPYVLASE